MPGPSPHALIWSEVQQHYELTTSGQPERCFRPGDEPAWHSWLDEHAAFAFVGKSGRISVLKEARSRGAGYWYAYRTMARHTRKHYLGPTARVTFDHLEEASRRLTGESPSPSSARSLAKHSQEAPSAHPGEPSPGEPGAKTWPQAEQGIALLSPKLSRPRLSTPLVKRERLFRELDTVRSHPLTLVSAPAGCGKTTLLSAWASRQKNPVAWLSLDALDNAVGMPAEFVAPMRQSPFWAAQEAFASTLVYDATLMGDFSLPGERIAKATVETLVIDGGTVPWISQAAQAVADTLPHAHRRTIAGQPHNVADEAMAPVLRKYFQS